MGKLFDLFAVFLISRERRRASPSCWAHLAGGAKITARCQSLWEASQEICGHGAAWFAAGVEVIWGGGDRVAAQPSSQEESRSRSSGVGEDTAQPCLEESRSQVRHARRSRGALGDTIGNHAVGSKFGWASTDFQRLGVRAKTSNMARLTARIGRAGILGIGLGYCWSCVFTFPIQN